jgi:membrane protein implicated in regulation of membrane protease activity
MLFLVVSMLLGHGAHGHGAGHGHSIGHVAGHGHAAGHGTGQGHSVGHAPGHGTGHGSGQSSGHSQGHGTTHAPGQSAGQKTGPENMSVWSFQMLLLFIGGFGIGGYFASISLLGSVLTLLAGAVGGVALAAVGYSGINFFYRRQSDSNIPSEEYVGLTGIVVTSIGPDGVGQIRCQIGDSRDTFLARSVDAGGVPINSIVRVVNMVGTTAIVEKVGPSELEPQWREQ